MHVSDSTCPPPLERFSADKFRQWLAGMVSSDPPSNQTDRDKMKAVLIEFLSVCPMVYDLRKREVIWEKIGNAAMASLESCNADLMQWANEVLAQIDASPGRVATCHPLRDALAKLDGQKPYWQAECLQLVRQLRFVLPVHARSRWTELKLDAVASAINQERRGEAWEDLQDSRELAAGGANGDS